MLLREKLLEDLKEAMKSKDDIKKNTIQMTRASILNEEKKVQHTLNNDEVEDIIARERKKRYESLALYQDTDRKDIVTNIQKEISILSNYLPQVLTEYELTNIIKDIINELGATQNDIGKVIRTVKDKYRHAADGKMTSDLVNKLLKE